MDKVAIITGAAGNLGRAMTQSLLDQGYHVNATLGPYDDPDFIQSDQLETAFVDLTDEAKSAAYVDEIIGKHKKVDLVVLTVGGFAMGDIHSTDWETINKMIKLNFNTVFFLLKPLIKYLEKQEQGSQIVLIGSRPALEAEEGKKYVAYALSKSMLFNLSEIINAECKGKGVTSTVIVPSTIDTPGNRQAMPDADYAQWVTPDEIASATTFLTTEAGKKLRHTVLRMYGSA